MENLMNETVTVYGLNVYQTKYQDFLDTIVNCSSFETMICTAEWRGKTMTFDEWYKSGLLDFTGYVDIYQRKR